VSSSGASPADGGREPRGRRVLSKSAKIGIGLLLTLVGLFLLTLLLPTDPGRLETLLPVAGAGILALWVGGVLMGIGSRS
jgi:hypothetical protein